jgi:hypothetical protein
MNTAVNARSQMQPNHKTETEPPEKTVGGGIMAGAGGAAAGAQMGAAMGSGGGPYGAIIGAAIGILAYALS